MSFSPILLFHICAGIRVAVWCGSNIFPQGFPPASRSWKRICHINAQPVFKRGVPGVHEIPNEQCFRRRSNVLPGGNGMGDRQAQRRGNGNFRLGCASGCIGARSCHRDLWVRSGEWPDGVKRWNSCWNVLFPWFRGSAFCRGGRSHAPARRCFRCTANRATSLAHVLCAVYRLRVFISRTATSIPRFLTQNQRTFCPRCPTTDIDDFLANPSSLHKCIQEEVNAKQWPCLLVTDLAFDSTSPQDTQGRMGNIRPITSPFQGHFRVTG
jgi:hypothetical protein